MPLLSSRGRRVVTGFAACAFALAAFSAASVQSVAAADQKILRIGQRGDPVTLDPHGPLSVGVSVLDAIYEPLVRWDAEGKLVGVAAESWTNVDPLTWEFKLRSGMTFHNGDPVTASDVKFTIDRLLNTEPALTAKRFVGTIASAEVVDDTTIRIVTKAPDAIAPLSFLAPVYIFPEKYFNEVGAEKFAQAPIGSGPFKFVSWEKGVAITLDAYDDYWQGRAAIDEVKFIPVEVDATRVAALQAGDLDLIDAVPTQSVAALEADPSVAVDIANNGPLVFLGFNTLEPPFNDVRARQALNYAVDADELIATMMNGYGTRALLGPQRAWGSVPLDVAGPYPYDPEMAKKLLAEAGYPNGLNIDCNGFRAGNYQELMQAVAVQLARVNVTCNVQVNEEVGTWFGRWLNKEIKGLYMMASDTSKDSVDGHMAAWFDSTRRSPYYDSPELNDMVHAARATMDDAERAERYTEIAKFFREDAPGIPLYLRSDIFARSAKVKNFKPLVQYTYVYGVDLAD